MREGEGAFRVRTTVTYPEFQRGKTAIDADRKDNREVFLNEGHHPG